MPSKRGKNWRKISEKSKPTCKLCYNIFFLTHSDYQALNSTLNVNDPHWPGANAGTGVKTALWQLILAMIFKAIITVFTFGIKVITGVVTGVTHDLCDAGAVLFHLFIPVTGTHEPNKLISSQLKDFMAQLVRALHHHSRFSNPMEVTKFFC